MMNPAHIELENGWTVGVASDIALTPPHPEDGERREYEVFYVMIENARGERWGSNRGFKTAEDAGRCLKKVAARLEAGESPMNSAYWYSKYPMYGSIAYMEQEPEMVARERADAEMGLD